MSNPNLDLKLMIIGRRKPGTTLSEHRHHIRHVHGELVLRYIAAEPDNAPQRYVQNAVFDGSYRSPGAATAADPFALNRDFVTQIWVRDLATLARSRQTAYYREHLQGDEDNFVDQSSVVFVPVRARELDVGGGGSSSSRPAGAVAAFKVYGLLQRADGVAADAFAGAWAEATATLHASAAGAALQQHTQNDVLVRPGTEPPLHGIDEFWLGDEAAARALLAQWRSSVHDALAHGGIAVASPPLALLAREDVVHAGPV